jgi:ATP-dependent exoDNAse (exonuclease V) beta subunit
MSPCKPAPDEALREEAVAARGVNVLVDAGAGTGKTTLLVSRLVEMVAPAGDAAEPLSLERIAAVTFTRRAAGELKLRVRERLLSELAAGPSAARRDRLAAALAAADTAFIGTIHGFADRLLRRRPVEARLSPAYEVVEDVSALAHEAFETLLQASEAGRLGDELEGTSCGRARAEEAAGIVRAALLAEVRAETKEGPWRDRLGLDALFRGFIEHRDVPPREARPPRFDAAEVQQAASGFAALARKSRGVAKGSRWMARLAADLEALSGERDPVTLFREVNAALRHRPGKMRRSVELEGDPAGWAAWKAWTGDGKEPGFEERLTGPLRRWMATRLVRTFPAVVAMYEKVKARHRAVDQVDLLLALRDVLARDLDVRREMQGLFDHVFVDEFQDTDPLQAEILLYLCEAEPLARAWRDIRLAPGKLTLVGDPKQSIYRFRRADISVYESVREIVTRGPHRLVPLAANFRSQPALVAHLNDRFDGILGKPQAGKPDFDPGAGTVVNRRLVAAREGSRERCVAVLPFASEDGKADADRAMEATVLATWIRAKAGEGLGLGDIAVLAHATTHVGLLTAEFDRLGVPWSARGGSLFLRDPLHRQFLLGLRAVADRDDGVAAAALLREPFFALDLADLVRARAAGDGPADVGIERARAAEALVRELRRRRFERPPGETARDLLERTGLARAVAFGPNGLQRLERLRELCFELERLAAADGLDYDGATARLREWAVEPVALDPPRPVGGDAVQVMSIHQAKGLEFPVVAWWDATATLAPRKRQARWFVERTGSAWALDLDGLFWEEPEGGLVLDREDAYLAAERLRLVYVAATRARDLLVLPVAGGGKDGRVTTALAGRDSPALEVHEAWTPERIPRWARGVKPISPRKPRDAGDLAARVEADWSASAAEAGRPRLVPRGVSTEAHRAVETEAEGEAGERRKDRESRFGRVFGDTVHAAVGIALRAPALGPVEAAARAARATGLTEHVAEAAEDVARALAALEREGLRRVPGPDLRLEYPVAAPGDGTLLQGYVDLLAVREGGLVVLDFKTDPPPRGDAAASYAAYVEQVRSYGRILVELGLARAGAVRCGLLFTGDGGVRWA